MCGTDLLCLRVRFRVLGVMHTVRVFLCLCYANMRASCASCVCVRGSGIMHVSVSVCVRMSESVCGIMYVCHVSACVYACVLLYASFCLWYAYVRVMCRTCDCVCVCEPCVDATEVVKHSV